MINKLMVCIILHIHNKLCPIKISTLNLFLTLIMTIHFKEVESINELTEVLITL